MATGLLLAMIFFYLSTLDRVDASYLLNDLASCNFGELPCDNGQCIDRKSWCDGPVDCFDESDEDYCRIVNPLDNNVSDNPNNCKKSKHFICESGLCIPMAGRCDDMPDCEDGEDEENCDYSYEAGEAITTTLLTETHSPTDPETTTDTTTSPKPTTTTTTLRPTTTATTTLKLTTTTTTTPKPTRTTAAPPKEVFPGDGASWTPSRFDALRKSVRHLIEERDTKWGWGKFTSRMISALYLANDSYFDLDNHDGLMTKKQLEVLLALDLMKNSEKPLRMHDLAHYVHALIVTCHNPKNFHGVNVVRLLRKAMAHRQSRGLFLHPLAYLALCNAGDFSDAYIRRLKNMGYRRNEEQRWLDIQAFALLAISCRTKINSTSSKEWLLLKKDVARNISDWQQPDGSFGSIYSTGLALQALTAAEVIGTEMVKGRAMSYLLTKQDWQGSFGSEANDYYVLPALNGNSLASIHARNCKPNPYGTQSTEGARVQSKKKKQMYVHYSLWIGGEKNEIHTITLGLPKHSNFLEVMEAAEKLNPRYKHEILTTARGVAVNAIAGRASDVERSTYWTLYRRVPLPFRPQLANTSATIARLKLLGAKRWIRDLRKLHPKEGEHLAFWYKPYL